MAATIAPASGKLGAHQPAITFTPTQPLPYVRKGILNHFFESDDDLVMDAVAPSPISEALSTILCHPHDKHSEELTSLVHAIVDAWVHGTTFMMRPDDVWVAILAQLKYLRQNRPVREAPRTAANHNVREAPKRPAGIEGLAPPGPLKLNVADCNSRESLLDAIRRHAGQHNRGIPHGLFTSSTGADEAMAHLVFQYPGPKAHYTHPRCGNGTPSIALCGIPDDWIDLQARVEKLASLDLDFKPYLDLLPPVLSRLVMASKEPDSEEALEFIAQAVRHSGFDRPADLDSGAVLTGWITAFCVFNASSSKFSRSCMWYWKGREKGFGGLDLDGVQYPWVMTDDIPSTQVIVPVEYEHDGQVYEVKMVAGWRSTRQFSGLFFSEAGWWPEDRWASTPVALARM